MPGGLGFNDALQPLWFRQPGDSMEVGLVVEEHHCNAMGICHGGVLMTLMDIALSGAVCTAFGKMVGIPTVTMGFDFLQAGRLGEWLVSEIAPVHLTRTLGFAHGIVLGPRGPIARANGCFRLPPADAAGHDFSRIAEAMAD